MAFIDEVALMLAGRDLNAAILSTASADATVYLENDGSANASLTPSSTAEAYYLATSSSGAELATSSTAQAFYLTDESSGWLYFKGHLPDSTVLPDRLIAVIETPGAGRMGRIGLERRGLQVVVRGSPQHTSVSAFSSAEAKATAIRDVLHEYTGSSASATHYVGIWCESGPAFSGFDEGWRPYFTADFRVMRATT